MHRVITIFLVLTMSITIDAAENAGAMDQKEFLWQVMSWVGLLSLVIGLAAGLYVMVLLALPGRISRLRRPLRATGFAVWLILSVLFIGAVLLSLLHSIGHNSTPSPDKALPYYVATFVISGFLAILATSLRRRRASQSTGVENDST